MAIARVGSGLTYIENNPPDVNVTTTGTKAVSAGSLIVASVKIEAGAAGVTMDSFTDSQSQVYTALDARLYSGGDPRLRMFYKENSAASATMSFTAVISSWSDCTYVSIMVDEFSGVMTSSSADGSPNTNQGTASPYTTGAHTLTGDHVVVMGIADFGSISGLTGAGSPTMSIGAASGDSGMAYVIANGNVTPGATYSSSGNQWVTISQAFKAAAGGSSYTVTAGVGAFTLGGQAASIVRVQFLGPASDVSNAGTWTQSAGGTLYGVIDEANADDADYIYSPDNPTNAMCEIGLDAGIDPVSSANHKVRYRASCLNVDSVLIVRLMQASATIAAWTSTLTAGASVQQFEQTLSGGQADSITNYADLRLQFTAS